MFPVIGPAVPHAVSSLKQLNSMNHKLILNTIRSGTYLDHAVSWFRNNHIALWAVNERPGQKEYSQSPKVDAHIFIDDAAIGCPLRPGIHGDRPMVSWLLVMDIIGELENATENIKR